MKSILLAFVFFWGASNVSADPTQPLTDEPLHRLDAFLKNPSPTLEEANELGVALQTLAYDISQKLLGAESKDWATPSPQRLAVIADAQRLLISHNYNLITASFDLDSGVSSYVKRQSRSLLDYTKADDIFETEVRKRLRMPDPKDYFGAASLLVEHRKFTPDDRNVLAAAGSLAKTEKEKIRWARTLAYYGMTEGLPVVRKLLEVPFDPTGISMDMGLLSVSNQFTDNYGPASEAAEYLGTDAASLIPLLEQRLREIENSNLGEASAPMIRDWKSIIRHAKGELPRKRRYAVNGSGPLDEPSRQVEEAEAPRPPAPSSGPIVINHPAPAPAPKPLPAAPAPKDSNPIWWIVSVVVALTAVVLVVRRKKPKP